MNKKRLLITLFAAGLIAVAAHGAAPGHPQGPGHEIPVLFQLQSDQPQPPARGWQEIQGALEEFPIAVDPAVVAANPAAVRIDLPYGPSLEAVRAGFTDYAPDWKSWNGTVRLLGATGPGTGYAYLGYHGDRITGVFRFEGESYQITGGIDGPQRLVRQSDDLADGRNCGVEEVAGTAPVTPEASGSGAEGSSITIGEQSLTRIDVMAVYPRAYFASPSSEISLVSYVQDSIAQANTMFSNSNVSAYYNLVHVGPIIGTQPSLQGPQGGLNLLNAQGSEISGLRNAYGADFVTMIVPYYWTGTTLSSPPCGVANMPVFNSSGTYDTASGEIGLLGVYFSTRTYSAFRQSCGFGDFTLGHEMGHNWGMWHDNARSGLLTNYAYAYYLSSLDKNTAMGCYNAGGLASTAAVCKRIGYFSDATVQYSGHATGDSTHQNALMARGRLGSYPYFKPQKTISPPTASFSRSCNSSTRVCSFDASGTTDNGSITKYQWDFGDGSNIVTTTSATINHTYGGSGTFYWVHLVATDNDGQRDLAIDSATF